MTREEWLTCDEPAKMLAYLQQHHVNRLPISSRKTRLFACACARQAWHLLNDDAPCPSCRGEGKRYAGQSGYPCRGCAGAGRVNRSHNAVEVAEWYADGLVASKERGLAFNAADNLRGPQRTWAYGCLRADAAEGAIEIARMPHDDEGRIPALQAALLREIAGDPFAPVTKVGLAYPATGNLWAELLWLTPTVVSLAEAAYAERGGRKCSQCEGGVDLRSFYAGMGAGQLGGLLGAMLDPSKIGGLIDEATCKACRGTGRIDDGTLDKDRLLVLADALLDAGCDSEELLRHLRGEERCPTCMTTDGRACGFCGHCGDVSNIPEGYRFGKATGWRPLRGPHVRGCWAVDLLLGKE